MSDECTPECANEEGGCYHKLAPLLALSAKASPLDDAWLTEYANMRPSYLRQQLLLGEARRAREALAVAQNEIKQLTAELERLTAPPKDQP